MSRVIHRFMSAVVSAVAWSLVATSLQVTLGWIVVGAAVIGMLSTIGCEPPRRIRRAVLVLVRARA